VFVISNSDNEMGRNGSIYQSRTVNLT